MVNAERVVIVWRFWIRWVLLTVAGYAVGVFAGFILGHILLGNIMIGIGIGGATGFFQWIIIRRHAQRSVWWILAGMVGLSVPLGLYALVSYIREYPFDLGWPLGTLGWALAFLLGGVLIGLPQRWILNRRLGRSAWWVFISAVGWALSVLGLSLLTNIFAHSLFGVISGSVAGGIILGIVTGGGLVILFRSPTPSGT